jgi:hypothetical protein
VIGSSHGKPLEAPDRPDGVFDAAPQAVEALEDVAAALLVVLPAGKTGVMRCARGLVIARTVLAIDGDRDARCDVGAKIARGYGLRRISCRYFRPL